MIAGAVPLIEARDVSKVYRLGVIGTTSLKEESARMWARLRGRSNGSHADKDTRDFWALRDVSFDVRAGDVLGIVGRNGAGKSTLLKILSRVTRQTAGEIRLRARMASLLEVGTGFHPDLTGRENIFLNGAILGMTKAEIRGKLDEIVDFAEIGPFLETPVKRYSSGMYVRLAFAVAAHLEPEILVVDEVLAVGDAGFQKKCLRKMGDVAQQDGRTVLFVSHNMAAVQSLCSRGLWLDGGRVVRDAGAREVVQDYLASWTEASSIRVGERADRGGNGTLRLEQVRVSAADGSDVITSSRGLRVELEYTASSQISRPRVLVGIYAENDVGVYGLDTEATAALPGPLPAGGALACVTGPINLTAGPCSMNIAVYSGDTLVDYVPYAARFTVEQDDFYGTGKTPGRDWMLGLVRHDWQLIGD